MGRDCDPRAERERGRERPNRYGNGNTAPAARRSLAVGRAAAASLRLTVVACSCWLFPLLAQVVSGRRRLGAAAVVSCTMYRSSLVCHHYVWDLEFFHCAFWSSLPFAPLSSAATSAFKNLGDGSMLLVGTAAAAAAALERMCAQVKAVPERVNAARRGPRKGERDGYDGGLEYLALFFFILL